MIDNNTTEYYKTKEFNRLRAAWREMKQEYNYISEFYKQAKNELNLIIIEEAKKLNLHDVFSEEPQEKKIEKQEAFEDESIKSVYRETAKASHPDVAGLESIKEFKVLAKAKKEQHLNRMLDVAAKFKVKNKNITYEQIDLIKKEIVEIKKKIDEIHSSIYWRWHIASRIEKNTILKNIINHLKNEQKK